MLFTRPRRSLLYVPGSHSRAMEKAKTLPADVLIFDLEDGVAAEVKDEARAAILTALKSDAYAARERVVRINRLDSREGLDDLRQLAGAGADVFMLPKVESAETVLEAVSLLQQSGEETPRLWANVETPLGILNAGNIAAVAHCTALVAGTNDLRAGLGLPHSDDRRPLHYALQALICAGRAYGKLVFDGTYIHFKNPAGLKTECEEGKWLGFDGKTLVHPEQVETTNAVFSPSAEEVAQAHATIAAYEKIAEEKRSVGILRGQMIEELHVRRAEALLLLAEKIAVTART